MNTRSIIIAAVLILGSLVCHSQIVASIDLPTRFSMESTASIGQFAFNVVESHKNATFESIDYSASSQKLAMSTVEAIQFISIVKGGEVYLKNMPVFSTHLNMSMANYEAGDYELHLTVEGKIVPTIIEIKKN